MNIRKKFLSIFLYLFVISALLDFKLEQLFDIKQLLLVITGTVILLLPHLKKGMNLGTLLDSIGHCSILACTIQTFILLFLLLSNSSLKGDGDYLLYRIALNCRPLLYGFCIWIICSGEKEPEMTVSMKIPTPEESYDIFRSLGLTKRESEVALQICRGLSNGEIAEELSISETTVKKHLSNIFEKLEIKRREELIQKRNEIVSKIAHE